MYSDNALLITARCKDVQTVETIVGNGKKNHYVYNKGYVYKNRKWQPFTLSCASGQPIANAWCRGSARATLKDLNLTDKTAYFVAYTCEWYDNTWKCGCHDRACTTRHWQLQAAKL